MYQAAKEIRTTTQEQIYVTGPLECNSSYIVMLSAVNVDGESPNATKHVDTSCQQQVNHKDVVPYVLFSEKKAVYKKDIRIGQSLCGVREQCCLL